MANIGGAADAEIDLPIEQVYAICADIETAPTWQDGLEVMDVLERDAEGRVLVANSTSDAKVRKVTTRLRFRYEPPTRVAWSQERGDLKSLEGAWELEDLGDGRTRATYSLDGDPGRMLGMLIRGPIEDRLREMLVGGRPGELVRRAAL